MTTPDLDALLANERQEWIASAPKRRDRDNLVLAALDEWKARAGAAASVEQYEAVTSLQRKLKRDVGVWTTQMGEKNDDVIWWERHEAERRGGHVTRSSLDEAKFWQTVFGESRSSRIKLARSAFRFDASTADLSDDEILARYDANPDWYSQ